MCGLVGFLSGKTGGFFDKDLQIFEQMLYADVLRGKDSTGVFAINSSGKQARGAKEASTAQAFLSNKDWHALRSWTITHGRAIIGHNRAATKGSVTDENAHPFHEGDIILVHNGTLWGDFNKHIKGSVAVDSHAICHMLNESGTDEVEKVVNQLDGAFALIWFDKRDNSINVIRNDKRTLYHCLTEDGFVFASEAGLINWIVGRHDRKFEKEPKLFQENVHSKFQWNGKGWSVTNTEVKIHPKSYASTQNQVFAEVGLEAWEQWRQRHNGRSGSYNLYAGCDYDEDCGIVELKPRAEPKITPTGKITPILFENEPVLIDQSGSRSTMLDFMGDAEIHMNRGNWVTGHCVDYCLKNPDNVKDGAFIYAIPKGVRTAIVRCFVPWDGVSGFEQTLMDSCLDSTLMDFKVVNRHWHRDPQSVTPVPTGFGLYYSSDMRPAARELKVLVGDMH